MSLHPYNNRHAVQSAALVVVFKDHLDAQSVSSEQISNARERLASRLSQFSPIQAFTFQMGLTEQMEPTARSSTVSGWQFFSQHADPKFGSMVERIAVVQDDRIAITENNYNRWEHFRELIDTVLKGLAGFGFEGRQLAFVAMGYSDVFIWKDSPEKVDASAVFAKNSKYLAQNVFDLGEGLFHSNHGFFVPSNEEGVASYLDNVNVSRVVNAETQHHNFVITAEHRLTPEKALYGADAMNFVVKHLESLHQRNKALLGGLLTDQVQKQIQLWGE